MDCPREGGRKEEGQPKRNSVCVAASCFVSTAPHVLWGRVVGVARMFWVVGSEVGDRKGGKRSGKKKKKAREGGGAKKRRGNIAFFLSYALCTYVRACVRACVYMYVLSFCGS